MPYTSSPQSSFFFCGVFCLFFGFLLFFAWSFEFANLSVSDGVYNRRDYAMGGFFWFFFLLAITFWCIGFFGNLFAARQHFTRVYSKAACTESIFVLVMVLDFLNKWSFRVYRRCLGFSNLSVLIFTRCLTAVFLSDLAYLGAVFWWGRVSSLTRGLTDFRH